MPAGLIIPARGRNANALEVRGVPMVERAAWTLHDAGVTPIEILEGCDADEATLRRLRAVGVEASIVLCLGGIPSADGCVVLSTDVVSEPSAVVAVIGLGTDRLPGGVAAAEASPGTLAWLPANALRALSGAGLAEIESAVSERRVARVSPAQCAHVTSRDEAIDVLLDTLDHPGEHLTYFHRRLHRQTRPMRAMLLRWRKGIRFAGAASLALSALAAWFVADGGYVSSLVGALLFLTGAAVRQAVRDVQTPARGASEGERTIATGIDVLSWWMLVASLVAAQLNSTGGGFTRLHAMTILSTGAAGILGVFCGPALRTRLQARRGLRLGSRSLLAWFDEPVLAYLVPVLALTGALMAFLQVATIAAHLFIVLCLPLIARPSRAEAR